MFEGRLPSSRMCELFFACSGILEAINHYDGYSYSLQETFYIARKKYASIWPLYVVTFTIAAILGAFGIGQWNLRNNLTAGLLNLLMLQPWFPSIQFSFNGVSWFIADLMLCYIVTPFLSYLLSVREQKAKCVTGCDLSRRRSPEWSLISEQFAHAFRACFPSTPHCISACLTR